jgi:hypothetical protein
VESHPSAKGALGWGTRGSVWLVENPKLEIAVESHVSQIETWGTRVSFLLFH